MPSTVLNVAGYPVDLDDGRTLASGESGEIDADLPHNRVLIINGQLLVTEGMSPRVTQPERVVKNAARLSNPEGDDR